MSPKTTTNTQAAHSFYQAFQQKDYATMQKLYADHATFTDPAFVNLTAEEVRAMWQMLLTASKDLALEYKILDANDTEVRIQWIATYTFSKTNRKVVNKIEASWVMENGLIIQHTDKFNFHTWAKQALGMIGLLLGWTNFLKNKVRDQARQNLEKFMSKN